MTLLVQVLRPFMLRRTKREVEKELPSKTEHVVKCAMSAWQKILYQQITDKVTILSPKILHQQIIDKVTNLCTRCMGDMTHWIVQCLCE